MILSLPALAGNPGVYQFEWQVKQEQPKEQILLVTDSRDGTTYIATPHIDKDGNQLYKIAYQNLNYLASLLQIW